MKTLKQWAIVISLLFTLTANWPPSISFAIEDAIIAVVNDELITLKDLKDYIQSTYVSLVGEGMSDREIQAVMEDMEINGTKKLIEDKLILSKANNVGIEVREELIDERIDSIKEKYGSEQRLIEALVVSGATLTDLRNKIRDQMKIKFIIDHEVKSKIYVNPQEVTNYYENNKDQFNEGERINLESIFIEFANDKEAARAKSSQALKEINANNDFKELVEKYSNAPSVGTVKQGELLPQIEKIVFNMRIDEISPPVEVDNGIFIFKLIGKAPAKIASLEDVKGSISDMLFNQKFKDGFFEWIDSLKKEAYIEIK